VGAADFLGNRESFVFKGWEALGCEDEGTCEFIELRLEPKGCPSARFFDFAGDSLRGQSDRAKVLDKVFAGPPSGGNDREAASHGFEDGHAESFSSIRVNQDVGTPVEIGHLGIVEIRIEEGNLR
jgi:hypothetical protein